MIDRRTVTAGLLAALATPARAAGTVTDSAGRAVKIPDRVTRVFPAGPPAAIMLYTLAPDLLLGWPRANRPEEREFLLPDIGARPEVGRITGRGNTANLEAVLALKPDLILDIGSTDATYVSLADRVQEQTGIPYALLDGRFDGYRSDLPHARAADRQARAKATRLPTTPSEPSRPSRGASPTFRPTSGRAVYYARGPRGLETGLGGSINVETIELLARNVAGGAKGGMARVSIEQVLLWNPDVIITIDMEFASDRAQRSGLDAGFGRARGPRASVAQAAVRLGRFPAVGQPADRTVVAREDSLSGAVPGGHPRAHRGFLPALLSRDADRLRRSTRCWRARCDDSAPRLRDLRSRSPCWLRDCCSPSRSGAFRSRLAMSLAVRAARA